MISERHTEKASMTVEAELNVSVLSAQLVHFHVADSTDSVLREDNIYRLDLCLTPRFQNARACYREHWRPNRFEPIGKMFLLPPGEIIQIKNDGAGQSQATILCRLDQRALSEWFERELKWNERQLKASLDISSVNIRNLLLRLGDEMRRPGFASETLIELIAAQLSLELGRYCSATADNTRGKLAPWRIRLVEERLREIGQIPSLAELAQLCDLSVRHLARSFRASRGCSIGDYIVESRAENAKRLLGSELSVKAIAYSLGFKSPSGFCYAFRRATGETPSEFRQRVYNGKY